MRICDMVGGVSTSLSTASRTSPAVGSTTCSSVGAAGTTRPPPSLGARPAQVLPGVLGRQLAADAAREAPCCAVSSSPVRATDLMLSTTPGPGVRIPSSDMTGLPAASVATGWQG